jgi:hypothetical protein
LCVLSINVTPQKWIITRSTFCLSIVHIHESVETSSVSEEMSFLYIAFMKDKSSHDLGPLGDWQCTGDPLWFLTNLIKSPRLSITASQMTEVI